MSGPSLRRIPGQPSPQNGSAPRANLLAEKSLKMGDTGAPRRVKFVTRQVVDVQAWVPKRWEETVEFR